MSSQFSNFTRSTAFSLTMSQAAVHELLYLYVLLDPIESGGGGRYGVSLADKRSLCWYLQRRGLIEPSVIHGCQGNWVLSEAGILLCPLLIKAGFKPRVKWIEDATSMSGRSLVGN